MKKFLKVGSLFILMCFAAINVQAQKFGYVNSQAILAEMPEVKQAEANLEALQKQLQKKLQDGMNKLQQDYIAIQQKVERGELSPKQQEDEAKKLQDRQNQLAQEEQGMVQQIQEKRAKELNPILEKVNKAIADVAKENGFQFIFEQGVLLYFEESQDVSALVKAKL
ncbi:MAG: OmpH family outer membrane protein [Saprospiraceae bacterium]|nr:OmpH family outer membrane protein [Lewinella sp.]